MIKLTAEEKKYPKAIQDEIKMWERKRKRKEVQLENRNLRNIEKEEAKAKAVELLEEKAKLVAKLKEV